MEPFTFVAVTTTRTVWPTSAATRTYVELVAPVISAQLAPVVSQSRQRYANEVGLPVQFPVDAASDCPCCAVPAIVGSAVFDGALPAALLTVAVAWVVDVVPSVAVATTMNV